MSNVVKAAVAVALAGWVLSACSGTAHHRIVLPSATPAAGNNGSLPARRPSPSASPTVTMRIVWRYQPPPAGRTWPTLTTATSAFGASAIRSAPVTGRFGEVAVVVHATAAVKYIGSRGEPEGGPSWRGLLAEVLAYRDGSWYRQASVPICVDIRCFGPTPQPGMTLPRQDWRADLTGATDFAVPAFDFTDVGTEAVISDTGDHWHLIPFDSPKGRWATIVVVGEQAGPHFHAFISGDKALTGPACHPGVAPHGITYQRWRYAANSDAFEPVGSPSTLCG